MNMILIAKIFELRGMIKSVVDLANGDEQYDYPMIESIESKINEITAALEESMTLNKGVNV
jgi:hypothetical protein